MSSPRSGAAPQLAGYEYIELLGSGGFADVFLYEQALPRRKVAVKVLRSDGLTDTARRQFTSEANVMAALSSHPYIVTIFGADTTSDGRLYLAMEYYSGPNLSVRCRTKPLGVPEALRIGVQLAGAVETAHRAGVLHRDLKPANVLTSAYGKPGLTDFGISVVTGELDSGSGGVSIPWSPPELLESDEGADARSDVYSLAATLYTILTGRSPFEVTGGSNSAVELMSRIDRQPVPVLGRDDAPQSLDRALAAGMAKSRDGRPPTAAAFARMLQSVERDLRLQPTDLDIPDDGESTAPAPESDLADGTRAKSPMVVHAQASASALVRPAPDSPAAPVVAPTDATRVRTTVAPEMPIPDEGTRVRPSSMSLEAPAGDRAGDASGSGPKGRRFGVVAAIIGIVLVAALGGVALTLLSHKSSGGSTSGGTGADVVDDNSLPLSPPSNVQVTHYGDGAIVTWTPAADAASDVAYLVKVENTNVEAPAAPGAKTLSLSGVPLGSPICVQVFAQESGRSRSLGARGCTS